MCRSLTSWIMASRHAWDVALGHGEKYGLRNSQVTALALYGAIGFMMDCDTTGVEPDLALVKYKKLVGGGMIKIVNSTQPSALIKLSYNEAEVNAIVRGHIDATGTIEGAPGIKAEHLGVFDCSFKPAKGTRSDSLAMGAHQDDKRRRSRSGVGRDFEDGEPAAGLLGGRYRRGLSGGVAPGHQGGCDLPRQLEGHAAAERDCADGRR